MTLAILTWRNDRPVLTICALGDSPLVVYKQHGNAYAGFVKETYATTDKYMPLHNTVLRSGNTQLSVNKALGDSDIQEVDHTVSSKQIDLDLDDIILLASDGLEDNKTLLNLNLVTTTNGQAVKRILKEVADTFFDEPFKVMGFRVFPPVTADDVTVMAVYCNVLERNKSVVCGVFDGHGGHVVSNQAVRTLGSFLQQACIQTQTDSQRPHLINKQQQQPPPPPPPPQLPNQSQPSNEPKAVDVTPFVKFMFDRFTNMYMQVYKTGPSGKTKPNVKFASNTSAVQGVDVFVKSHLKLHDLAEQVHRQTINAIINNIRIDDQAFGDLYSTYFGVHGIFPSLLHTYFKTATYDPPQLTDTEQKAMFGSLVVAWAALPLEYNRDGEGTIDNAGGGKCGYISIMLSLLLNTETFDKSVAKMLAKLTTHQKTVLESIEGLKANEQAEQTELERAQALVAKLELQRQQALQTYKAANVVLNNLTTQLGNICKTQNQTLQELDEFNTILTLVKRQQHEANVQRVQTIIKGLRARVADLSLQSAKSQQGKNQQLEQVTQLEKQNRLASQAHQRATTQLDNQTKALRNAQHELKIYTSISNNLAIILQKLYANPLEYRNELLGSYNVVKQVIKHKRDTPPTTCILLIMTFLYRNNKDMLEQLATSQAHTQLGMNELEKLSEDLEICCALVLPNGELNARVLKIYPPELEKWWDMYKKNNTRVWIESTGSLQNKKFDGNHYVTHDFNERIEAFGKLIKPL